MNFQEPIFEGPKFTIVDWGLIDYEAALKKQIELVEAVADQRTLNTIIFCSHPPVVTKGRVTKPEDITTWSGPVVEVSRGGRATYHGPSQLVIYPIVALDRPMNGRKPNDVVGFLRDFENAIVKTMKDLGISAVGKSIHEKNENETAKEETGVWVGTKKVASLGLAVKRWTTYHGAAINIDYDPEAFLGMMPCGFKPNVMISVEELLGAKPDLTFIKMRLQERFKEIF